MSNFVFKTSNISPHFFPQFFQEWIFWHFCIFWPTKWIFMALVLIFSKFGMYLPYKNRFWADFSWFLARCTYSTVWTRSGPKIDFQLLVSKGLRGFFKGTQSEENIFTLLCSFNESKQYSKKEAIIYLLFPDLFGPPLVLFCPRGGCPEEKGQFFAIWPVCWQT